jgi:hypothetical protein
MLGGVDSTTARRHAAELLEHAGASIHNARRVGS